MGTMIANSERTTEEDRDNGWTDSDWMNHTRLVDPKDLNRVGYVENWRFQLNRALNDVEYSSWSVNNDHFNPDLGMQDVDQVLRALEELASRLSAAPLLRLVRIRIGGIERAVTGAFSYESGEMMVVENG